MCQMINLFVPSSAPMLASAGGLKVHMGGELQKDFLERFGETRGTFLNVFGAGYCMCGFDDWESLYALASEVMSESGVEWAAVVHFSSGCRYALKVREVDPDESEQCTAIDVGEVVVLRGRPAEQQRHRRVLRALQTNVRRRVSLVMKSGRALHGVLMEFDEVSEVGRVDKTTFVAAQVHSVGEDALG
jgi:hypothetical protein